MPSDRPPDARAPDPAASPVAEAFTAATVTAFGELCGTWVTPGEAYATRAAPTAGRVAAEIGLLRATPGLLVLAFPRPVLEALAARFLPGEAPLTTEIADDAAGEFANVIAGQAKTMLKGTDYHFNLSTPRLGGCASAPAGGSEFLVLPFDSDAGGFSLCVNLAPCGEGGTGA